MIRSIVVLMSLALSSFSTAHASDPCEPVRPAQPTYISCKSKGNFVSITVNSLLSPAIPECAYPNSRESHTAEIEISNARGEKLATVSLEKDTFTYSLDIEEGSSFRSPLLKLNLKGCSTPIHGGLSAGN